MPSPDGAAHCPRRRGFGSILPAILLCALPARAASASDPAELPEVRVLVQHVDVVPPSWSPDDRFVVVHTDPWGENKIDPWGQNKIAIVNVKSGAVEATIDAGPSAHRPAWSPLSQWISLVAIASADSPGAVLLAEQDEQGSWNVAEVLRAQALPHDRPWGPSGERFLYQGEHKLFVVEARTRTARKLLVDFDFYPAGLRWSADGQSIVAAYKGGVVTIDSDDGSITQLSTRTLKSPLLGPGGALWALEHLGTMRSDARNRLVRYLDGTWTDYEFASSVTSFDVHPRSGLVVVGVEGMGLYLIDTSSGARRSLTSDRSDAAPSWSPSGPQVAFVRGYRDLAVLHTPEHSRTEMRHRP